MIYNTLGTTGMKVSKLCFGSLTLAPLQGDLSIEEGGELIAYGMERGINFLDTATLYENYGAIKKAMEYSNKELIIATKSYDYDKIGAQKNLHKALRELNRDYIDVFLLHEQESIHTIRGHWEAIEYLIKEKEKGTIRALGISSHRVEGVYGACKIKELEVIHPIINIKGLGIEDGSRQDMEQAISYAKSKGKGIYAMKIFGGGNLSSSADECFEYALNLEDVDSMAIGMITRDEIDYNVNKILGLKIEEDLKSKVKNRNKKLLVEFWCTGCGMCVEKCHQNAMEIVDEKAQVDLKKCLVCGYCGAYCPQFCIKVV